MIVGFTGTRRGMTSQQLARLATLLDPLPDRVLHGGAIGADLQFDAHVAPLYWARGTGPSRLLHAIFRLDDQPIGVYPADAQRQVFWMYDAPHGSIRDVYEPSEPLARNKVIARTCDRLIACPAEADEVLRSGTWATVRYARKAGKLVTIIFPDGTVEERV